MSTKSLGVTAAILATVLLAACGGGGSSATHPAAIASPASNGGSTTQGTGARLTFTINRAPKGAHQRFGTASRRGATAKRSPQYFSSSAAGLQITITSGTASKTLYADISTVSPNCTYNASLLTSVCTLSVPTLGPAESLSVIEVDQTPSNEVQATGLGTAFPSNSHVLAIAPAQTITLTPGTVSNVAVSLNPVAALLSDEDCNINGFDNNMQVDDVVSSTAPRLVVTPNVASSTSANPAPADIDGQDIVAYNCAANAAEQYACTSQPLADVNASPVPTIATSNSSALTLYMASLDQVSSPNSTPIPLPPASTFTQTASIPDTSFLWNYGADLLVNYTGAPIAAGTTITVANNLTATPPVFTGSPVPSASPQPATYAASMTYTVVPLTVSPTSSQQQPILLDGSTQIVGSDPGSSDGLGAANVPTSSSANLTHTSACMSGSTTIATISPGAYDSMTGTQAFTLNSSGLGTCSFVLFDRDTGVVTNTIYVSTEL